MRQRQDSSADYFLAGRYVGWFVAETLAERSRTKFVTPWPIATLYTRAGMNKEAIDWLEKAYQAHDGNMPYISVDPIFHNLRNEPRFQNLLHLLLPNSGLFTCSRKWPSPSA